MKALVVGLGSIGMRHSEVLKDLGHDVVSVSRHEPVSDRNEHSLEAAVKTFQPQYVVIAQKTIQHFELLKTLLDLKFEGLVLVEKPLFESPRDLPVLGRNIFVGYNLRFHPMVKAIKEFVANQPAIHIHAYVGQHLSLWRKGSDHLKSYSAHRDQGGGVLRDLSHELDYLAWLTGPFESVTGFSSKIGDVTVSSEDSVMAVLRSAKGTQVALHLNYLDFVHQRRVVVTRSDSTLIADFMKGELQTPEGTQAFKIERNDTYREMHKAVLSGNTSMVCSYREGCETLKLIQAIEKSAAAKTSIAL